MATSASTSAPASTTGVVMRPSVVQLSLKDRNQLYASYISFFSTGGMFIPTTRNYRLGDDVYLLLTLPEDTQRYPVAGRVAWVTPAGAAHGRTQGVGIRFPSDDKAKELKGKIEHILGPYLGSSRPTQTL